MFKNEEIDSEFEVILYNFGINFLIFFIQFGVLLVHD